MIEQTSFSLDRQNASTSPSEDVSWQITAPNPVIFGAFRIRMMQDTNRISI